VRASAGANLDAAEEELAQCVLLLELRHGRHQVLHASLCGENSQDDGVAGLPGCAPWPIHPTRRRAQRPE